MKLFFLSLLLAASSGWASTCDSGQRQSPIDIRQTRQQKLPALEPHYLSVPLKIANDGKTVRVRFAKGSSLRIGNQTYTLQQFHFHTPGGDRIAGEEFPMVAHLLHRSSSGQLLGLAVLFRSGAEHPLMARLLPLIPARPDGDHAVPQVQVSARELLPERLDYFRYAGSLTAPPCTEGVDWIVLQQPEQLAAGQLARYRERFADNMRGVQPLHGRVVLQSLPMQ